MFYITNVIYSQDGFKFTDKKSFSEYIHIPVLTGSVLNFFKITKTSLPYYYIIIRSGLDFCYFSSDGAENAIINSVSKNGARLIILLTSPEITRGKSHFNFKVIPDTFIFKRSLIVEDQRQNDTNLDKNFSLSGFNHQEIKYNLDSLNQSNGPLQESYQDDVFMNMGFTFNGDCDFNYDENMFNM